MLLQINISVTSCEQMFSFLLEICLEVELLGYGNSLFNLLRNCQTIFLAAVPLYVSMSFAGGLFLHILVNTHLFSVFDSSFVSYPRQHKVVSHCGFEFHFPDD